MRINSQKLLPLYRGDGPFFIIVPFELHTAFCREPIDLYHCLLLKMKTNSSLFSVVPLWASHYRPAVRLWHGMPIVTYLHYIRMF